MPDLEKANDPLDSKQFAQQANVLEEDLAGLRARFDQFFLGLEKKNPEPDLVAFRKRIVKLKGEFIRNTGLKYRIQSLFMKFQSYERLWLKTLKEREDGIYSRDLFKLRRKQQKEQEQKKKEQQPGAAPEAQKKVEPKKKEAWSLDDDLEADLPDELFGEVKRAPAGAPLPKPIGRQKTDPALPEEMGGPTAAKPAIPAPSVATAPLQRQGSNPPPPPSLTPLPMQKPVPRQGSNPPPPPPGSAGPAPRQGTPRPQPAGAAPAPIARQGSNPPPAPAGAVARQGSNPPSAPVGAPVARQGSNPPPRPAQPVARQPSPPPPAARPASPAAPVGMSDTGLTRDKVQKIYDAFVTAKKRCRESTDGITLEAVEQSLKKQVPQLMKEHGAKSVDFKVVISNGKAVLKAVPK